MIYHYIESLLTLPLLFAILATVVEFRFPRKKCILLISAAIAIICFITVALNLLGFSQTKIYTYVWFITGIPSFLCILYLAKYRDGSFLFVFLSEFVLAGFCTIFSFITAYYLPYPDEIEIIFLHFIFLLTLYLVFRFLFRDKYFPAARTRGNLWYLYCLLPLFSLLLFKMYSTSPGQNLDIDNKVALPYLGYIYPYSIPFLIVLLAMFCYMLILIMLMITYNHRIAMEREEKMHLDFFADTLNQKLMDTEEKNDSLRILRHDIHFHINAIYAMIQNNKIDDAKTYLHDLGVIFDQTKTEKYCVNPVINAILDFYAGKASELNIDFLHTITVPSELSLSDIDLGVVVSNALENSIHACGKMPSEFNRWVEIKFIRHRQQYILAISNPYVGSITFDADSLPVSDMGNHGYGTKSIVAICKKYDATVDYLAENGIFTLRIMFTE